MLSLLSVGSRSFAVASRVAYTSRGFGTHGNATQAHCTVVPPQPQKSSPTGALLIHYVNLNPIERKQREPSIFMANSLIPEHKSPFASLDNMWTAPKNPFIQNKILEPTIFQGDVVFASHDETFYAPKKQETPLQGPIVDTRPFTTTTPIQDKIGDYAMIQTMKRKRLKIKKHLRKKRRRKLKFKHRRIGRTKT
jgi:hypothetical protein